MKSLLLAALTMCSLALSAQTITYKEYRVGDTSSDPTSPWITDGGSCRIGVYVDGEYDHDYNLSITIDNDKSATKEKANCNINNQMKQIYVDATHSYIYLPFDFFVKGDESIVDHYEACCYLHRNSSTYPLLDATDENGTFTGQNGTYLADATTDPTGTYNIPVQPQIYEGQNSYEAWELVRTEAQGGLIVHGLLLPAEANSGVVTATVYVRVHFKAETGLAPVDFDLQNVQNQIKKNEIITDIEDLNVDNNIAPVYYDLGGRVVNAEQMGKGIYIKRIGNKSEKVLVR